ncbi:ABC transporter ATP-binding protein [Arthrobacter rhombi]|uniref:ABC-type probable sulfate transporter, ATPase component n=1 Tax=Arthrobacter rhombi TaxID=71253 RepID=A0A1R4G874_9MICC|nr:ABC transporter ATP-binding protein [Arthrobacter rhombi]SJM64273.1 ABC-type probable sulfate transporter, ATPase component [Arthrobacter rhombi]
MTTSVLDEDPGTSSSPHTRTDPTTPDSPAANPPASVVLDGLSKSYASGPTVLDGISTTIARGEFVCLLGASGCGKSTLLQILAGLELPTAGTVQVPSDGAAFMFQDASLLPWLSARANVELALRLRGVPRAERRPMADTLLELVHLGGAADQRPHQLSGGMRQRTALARALAQDRELLLMDEPFGALDAITRDLLHEELERVWTSTGRTIVFVTHNVREAIRLGQRVILLSSKPGRIARQWQVGPEVRRNAAATAALTEQITRQLRQEISGHAHP